MGKVALNRTMARALHVTRGVHFIENRKKERDDWKDNVLAFLQYDILFSPTRSPGRETWNWGRCRCKERDWQVYKTVQAKSDKWELNVFTLHTARNVFARFQLVSERYKIRISIQDIYFWRRYKIFHCNEMYFHSYLSYICRKKTAYEIEQI